MARSDPPDSDIEAAASPALVAPAVVDLTQLPGVECPCGVARRAFEDRDDFPGTVHLTEIHSDARTHYHREHTEVYVILACDEGAAIELDGQSHPVKPKTTILIPPGTRHRAVGKMEVLIICLPKFDPTDEHFDYPVDVEIAARNRVDSGVLRYDR